ncbi:hypothetical protein EfmAA610_31620 (plasmid) [Enterococcus faecium]|nr:hypothetical protein EfmAA610_31620 [Enterococcus faecium]
MITKTRKQGNSIMLTVPKDFNVPNGVEVEAKLVENGILYEFVEPHKADLKKIKQSNLKPQFEKVIQTLKEDP